MKIEKKPKRKSKIVREKGFGTGNVFLLPSWTRKLAPAETYIPTAALSILPNTEPTKNDRLILDFTDANRDNITDTNPDLSSLLFYKSENEKLTLFDAHNVTYNNIDDNIDDENSELDNENSTIDSQNFNVLGLIRYIDNDLKTAYLLGIAEQIQIMTDAFLEPIASINTNLICELWYNGKAKKYELSTNFENLENDNWYLRIATVRIDEPIYTENENTENETETEKTISIISLTILEIYNKLEILKKINRR